MIIFEKKTISKELRRSPKRLSKNNVKKPGIQRIDKRTSVCTRIRFKIIG